MAASPTRTAQTAPSTEEVLRDLSDFAVKAMDFLRSGRASFDVKFSVDSTVFKVHKLVV
jgi:hypothetical protein